jgi:hypothetical protein
MNKTRKCSGWIWNHEIGFRDDVAPGKHVTLAEWRANVAKKPTRRDFAEWLENDCPSKWKQWECRLVEYKDFSRDQKVKLLRRIYDRFLTKDFATK